MSQPRVNEATAARIPELDGLRGIAILWVVSFHYVNNQLLDPTYLVTRILSKLTSFGWIGVDLFFVLSGLLIGTVLLRNKNSESYFSTFYIRRIARIIPNYYLLILLFLTIKSIPNFSDNYFLTGNDLLPCWTYFAMINNFYMAYFKNMGNSTMSVSWSIAIEEQFYILFPFIVYFLRDKWLPYLLVAAIILSCVTRLQFDHWIPAYVLLPSRMDAISFGVLIAYYNLHYNLTDMARKYSFSIILVMMLDVIASGCFYFVYGDLGVVKHSLFALFFAGCLTLALTKEESLYAAFLRTNWLRWVGSISYSLYLIHYLMLGLFHHIFANNRGIGIRNEKDLLVSVLALIASFGFAWLMFKTLETPMINWGKRFKY